MAKRFKKDSEFQEKVVSIKRVSRTVKGGRIFKFAVVVIVGNKKGKVGMGTGKSGEIPDAVRKGIENAKKNMRRIEEPQFRMILLVNLEQERFY